MMRFRLPLNTDVLARMIVRWRVAISLRNGLALGDLEQPLCRSPGGEGFTRRSDREAQYLSIRYSERLAEVATEGPAGAGGGSDFVMTSSEGRGGSKNVITSMKFTANHRYEKVFFCSAYNDISHILALMGRGDNTNCLIVVTNKYNIYNFLNMLNIKNTQIFFISSKLTALKNPINWALELQNIMSIRKRLLRNISDSKIIFFASFYDLLTCSCVNFLRKNNELYLSIPIEDYFVPLKKRSLKIKLFSLVYGVRLMSFSRFKNTVVGLPLSYIKENVHTDLLACEGELFEIRRKYAISVSDNMAFILLLDAKDNYSKRIRNYTAELTQLYRFLADYNVYVKGHPQLGLSPLALDFNFKTIDSDIPVEFIDLSNCRCVIGIESIAIANIANMGIKSISLLRMLNYKDNTIRNGWLDYLRRYSDNILFPESFFEFKNHIIEIQES